MTFTKLVYLFRYEGQDQDALPSILGGKFVSTYSVGNIWSVGLDLSAGSSIVSCLSSERTILRYKIRDIPTEGLAAEVPLEKQLFETALEGTSADLSSCYGNLRIELSKDERDVIFVRGRLRGKLGLACGRCLAPAELALDVPLHMTFTPPSEEEERDASPKPKEDRLEDVDFGVHEGEMLDLEPTVRELVILAVPISPLCKESCAGLCPVCGANRNDEPSSKEKQCGHTGEQKPDNPRFGALKNLKLKS